MTTDRRDPDPAGAPAPVPVGRFAPSPTGPLHAGSLATALASRLDALARGGRWLLRIEDLDPPREMAGAADDIIETLARLGFEPDGEVVRQSRRHPLYAQAFERLLAAGAVYPCACTRREIADSITGATRARHATPIYPGTCRQGLAPGRTPRAWRVRVDQRPIDWQDRHHGRFSERLDLHVGDFVVRRADGQWAYQLAVVVDDAQQMVTDVVRGADLLESTARQIHLQRLLGLPTLRYLHLPLIRDAHGEKLSKQTGARAIDGDAPLAALEAALRHLGLGPVGASHIGGFWRGALACWQDSSWMRAA